MALTIEPLRPVRFTTEQGRMVARRLVRGIPSSVAKGNEELGEYFNRELGTSFAAGSAIVQRPVATLPGFPNLFLEELSVDEFGDEAIGEGVNRFDQSGLEVPKNGWQIASTYRSPSFDQGPTATLPENENQDMPELPVDTFLTVRITMGMEVMAIDKSGLEWNLANGAGSVALGVNTSVAAFLPTETLHMTWMRVRFPPWTNIRSLRGNVNDTTFFGHEPETVMFLGMDASREFQVNGVRQWELGYKFGVKEVKYTHPTSGLTLTAGWNHFFRSNPGSGDPNWQKIITSNPTRTDPIYPLGNLGLLFVSEQN